MAKASRNGKIALPVFTLFLPGGPTTWPTLWVVYETDRMNIVVQKVLIDDSTSTGQAQMARCLVERKKDHQLDRTVSYNIQVGSV